MNQLRTADLLRYRQNFQQHKQKIKSIMNRSTQSVHSLTQKQKLILSKTNSSHEKALKFKFAQKQRQINFVNNNFINRIYSNDKKRTKLFEKQINSSRTDLMRAKSHLIKSPGNKLTSSRTTIIQKDNSFMNKKISEVKSTISLKDFNKEYNKHAERSSMISKFKIDARNFKFIPKNEILLEKIGKVKSALPTSRSRDSMIQSGFITERIPVTNNQTKKFKTNRPLVQSSLQSKSAQNLSGFKNIKLQKLKINEKKIPAKYSTFNNEKKIPEKYFTVNNEKKILSKHSTVMKLSNPETTVKRGIKFNNF